MDAATLYLIVKKIHVYSVITSFSLFLFRGGLMMTGSLLLQHRFLRIVPHVVDSLLLFSALWLTTIVQQYPFVNHWLTVKVLLLVVYIVLGTFALKRGRTRGVRIVYFVLALAVFLFIVSVARSHDPAGIFRLLGG